MKNKLIKIIKELQEVVDSLSEQEKLEEEKDQEQKQFKLFQPTAEQLERWKQIPPTKKTMGLLGAKGFSDEEIKAIPTQHAANIILNNLKKENI